MSQELGLPDYLSSLGTLQQHFRAQMKELNTTAKGDAFAHFVQRLIPQTDRFSDYDLPTLSKNKSVDQGVDLTAQSKSGDASLFVQSKLWVDGTEDIDSVISKFQAYASTEGDSQQYILIHADTKGHFLLVSLSPLAELLKRYEKKDFASRAYFRELKSESRIDFVDGNEILQTLRTAYRKITPVTTNLTLNLVKPCISQGDVHIGIIAGSELKGLYKLFGDALFFENVRDFLGVPRTGDRPGRTTPNTEIIRTLTSEPEKMLSRNNGLVFGAEKVDVRNQGLTIILTNGGVVNGCQTTMCVVEAPDTSSHILVKVVQTPNAWDVTKSANFQNSVPDIDLDLARYLRPQLVKRAAANVGVAVEHAHKSAFQIVDEIYNKKVAYDETRLLYIGLLSRTPNNVFASNYTELAHDVIAGLYAGPSYEEDIFDTLFQLQDVSQRSLGKAKATFTDPQYADLFKRYYADDSLSYRCFVSILALCGALNVNIASRSQDAQAELARTRTFLSQARDLFAKEPSKFSWFYMQAVKVWMQQVLDDEGDDSATRRDMYLRTKQSNFTNMFRKLRMEGDLEARRSQ